MACGENVGQKSAPTLVRADLARGDGDRIRTAPNRGVMLILSMFRTVLSVSVTEAARACRDCTLVRQNHCLGQRARFFMAKRYASFKCAAFVGPASVILGPWQVASTTRRGIMYLSVTTQCRMD